MVTSEQVELVQLSWSQVESISEAAAELFYGKLFQLNPSLSALFPDDMAEQRKKLMQTLSVCVYGLSTPGDVIPAVRALGERHIAYKVRDEDYETVGIALLWTLEQGLGDSWTPALKSAGTDVYE